MQAMSQPTYIDEYTRPVDLNPRTTALLIIDMQYASGSRHHGLGKHHCDAFRYVNHD